MTNANETVRPEVQAAIQYLQAFLQTDDDDMPYELGRLKRRLETVMLNGMRDLLRIPLPAQDEAGGD